MPVNLLSALLLAAQVPAAAPTPPFIRAHWVATNQDPLCALDRVLGDTGVRLFSFRALPASGTIGLLVHRYDGEPVDVGEPVTVVLGGTGAVGSGIGRSGLLGPGSGIGFAVGELPEDFVEQAARAKTIGLTVRGRTVLDAPLGDMRAATIALRSCLHGMMRKWGIDPAAYAALQSRPQPMGALAAWIAAEDYPAEALRNEWVGRVLVRLDIDAAGAIGRCTTLVSSGHAVLDAQSCVSITGRGRFVPARGADGRPAAASYVTQVNWTIGE